MKSIRQLLRQPMKTFAGILLTALAVAVLCVSFSQPLSAVTTIRQMKEDFPTIAMPSGLTSDAESTWIRDLMLMHPDLVLDSASHGLASAYIEGLCLDNFSDHYYNFYQQNSNNELEPGSRNYSSVILEVTISYINSSSGSAVVNRAIGLEPGYDDPAGYTVHFTLDTQEDIGQLRSGDRCLIYVGNYRDQDWEYRCQLTATEDLLLSYRERGEVPQWVTNTYRPSGSRTTCRIGNLITYIDASRYRTLTVTLTDGSSHFQDSYSYEDSDGSIVRLDEEEYAARYTNPTIVRLDGSAEEFLASEENTLWRQAFEDILINNHVFPVIGVTDLNLFADFACTRANITQGRGFTQEEYESGQKVCLISESMAQANGLSVGDTVSARFLNYDFGNPYQEFIRDGEGIVYPTAYTYRSASMSMNEEESYTIVGIYQQEAPWGSSDNNLYAFTPNTIFVPIHSVTGSMDYSDAGMFRTLRIDGDRLFDLQMMTIEDDMESLFTYYDNGYNEMTEALEGYQAAAEQILPLGIVVYAVVMLLYLFLFPGRQGRDLSMMESFGAPLPHKLAHILLGCLGILLPGSVIGTAAAISLWRVVSEALRTYMGTTVSITFDPQILWIISGIQVLIVLFLTACLALAMVRMTNFMKRR